VTRRGGRVNPEWQGLLAEVVEDLREAHRYQTHAWVDVDEPPAGYPLAARRQLLPLEELVFVQEGRDDVPI
jgi:hypothetical protein